MSSSKRKKLKSPSSSPPKHTFGGSDRFAPNAPAHIIRQPGQDQRGALSPAELILPDAPTLGNTLSSRAASQQHSHSSNTNPSTSTSPVRMSSNGTVLRRGSQVMTAPRQQVRQYRHPREMESALIDSEAKIALLEDKLDATTSVLRRTQSELLQRNADLEAANVKTNSLMLMVQELLQHVVEKREGRRFSETVSYIFFLLICIFYLVLFDYLLIIFVEQFQIKPEDFNIKNARSVIFCFFFVFVNRTVYINKCGHIYISYI